MPSPLRRPPGPFGLPLLGASTRFRKDPLAFLHETAREYGDVSEFRLGLRKTYLVARPDLVGEVLAHSGNFFVRPVASPHAPDFDAFASAALEWIESWHHGFSFDAEADIRRLFPALPLPPGSSDEDPKSAIDLLVGGHPDPLEATGSAIAWTLISLASHVEWQQRIAEGFPALEFVSEVLRLYPPVWVVSRTARSQYRLLNYLLSPRSLCLLSPWVTHRLVRYWPEPDRFDPLRFSDEDAPERPKFAYFPFGSPGVCTGQGAVLDVLDRVVASVVSRWRLSLSLTTPLEPWAATPILWPRKPVRIAVAAC